MYTDDKIAAAQIAKLFGSELLNIQNSAKTDSGATPDIVKMHPKQFLISSQQTPDREREQNRRMLESIQRQAEAAHPLPSTQFSPSPPESFAPPAATPSYASSTFVPSNTELVTALEDISKQISLLTRELSAIASVFCKSNT